MIKYYSITKADIPRLKNVAEKFYTERLKLDNKLISWESFTTEWMWFELPESLLDEANWKANRSGWKNAINDILIEQKRPCELFAIKHKGVKLEADKFASHKYVANRIKSYSNNVKNTRAGCSERMQSNPESKKLFKRIDRMFESFAYQAIGAIDDSRIPHDLKTEWKTLFKRNIIKNKEED